MLILGLCGNKGGEALVIFLLGVSIFRRYKIGCAHENRLLNSKMKVCLNCELVRKIDGRKRRSEIVSLLHKRNRVTFACESTIDAATFVATYGDNVEVIIELFEKSRDLAARPRLLQTMLD